MSRFKATDLLDRTFEVGITLKGLDGVLEVVGGLLLLVVSPATINQLVGSLTQHELSQDPHDFIATHLLNAASGLTGSSGLRCLRGLAHLSRVPQTGVPPRSPSPACGGGSGWGRLAGLSDDVVRSVAGVGRSVGGRRVVHAGAQHR